jgi:hypothetical protein
MPNVFKVTVVQYWLFDAWLSPEGVPCSRTHRGKVREVPQGEGRDPGEEGEEEVQQVVRPRAWPNETRAPVANKVAAQQLLAALVKKAELGRAGILDPFEEHRKRPLAEHLAEQLRRGLEARGNVPVTSSWCIPDSRPSANAAGSTC